MQIVTNNLVYTVLNTTLYAPLYTTVCTVLNTPLYTTVCTVLNTTMCTVLYTVPYTILYTETKSGIVKYIVILTEHSTVNLPQYLFL